MNKTEKITRKILGGPLGIILFVISLAAFYLPYEAGIITEVVEVLPWVGNICGGLLIIVFFVLFISRLRVFRDNWYLLAAIAFIGILIYSTILNDADVTSVTTTKGLAAVFLVLTVAIFFTVNPKRYMLIAYFMFLAVSIANVYCIFKYWGVGLWEVWHVYRSELISIVGNYNGGPEYAIPMIICGSAYAQHYGRWLDIINYPAMIMCLVMAFKVDSWVQIAVYSAMLFLMVMGSIAMLFKKFAMLVRWICNPILMVLINATVYISVIWVKFTAPFEAMGIDADFHNRRAIWDAAIEWIRAKPVWGNGMEIVSVKGSKLAGYGAHCHSFFLDVTYMTGIVGTIIFVTMLVIVIVRVIMVKRDRLAYSLSTTLFALCMANLFEMYTVTFVVLSLALIYYIAKNEDHS